MSTYPGSFRSSSRLHQLSVAVSNIVPLYSVRCFVISIGLLALWCGAAMLTAARIQLRNEFFITSLPPASQIALLTGGILGGLLFWLAFKSALRILLRSVAGGE